MIGHESAHRFWINFDLSNVDVWNGLISWEIPTVVVVEERKKRFVASAAKIPSNLRSVTAVAAGASRSVASRRPAGSDQDCDDIIDRSHLIWGSGLAATTRRLSESIYCRTRIKKENDAARCCLK